MDGRGNLAFAARFLLLTAAFYARWLTFLALVLVIYGLASGELTAGGLAQWR